MENPPLEYQSKEFIKQTHKGGSIIQKMLNINDDENSEFSVDEYRNAIHNERTKRNQQIRANNDEHKLRRELRLINAIIDPTLIDKKSTLKQEIQSRLAQSSKYINDEHGQLYNRMVIAEENRKLHSEIQSRLAMSSKYIRDMQDKLIERTLVEKKSTLKQEMQSRLGMSSKYISEIQEQLRERTMTEQMKQTILKQEMQSRITESNKELREMQDKLKERVMAERMRQSLATTIRKKNNKVFEMREIAKNNGQSPTPNLDNWNVNNINIENDEDTNKIKRIIITKRRGRMADEIVNAKL